MPARNAATRPGVRFAAASTIALAAGLRLCGIVEEPPPGSATSATSCCISSEMSRATLPSVATYTPQAQTKAARRSRCVCHGTASGKPRCRARSGATCGPRSPRAASVPAAPPNCSAMASAAAASTRRQPRDRAATHPATFKPNVIGGAGCRSVRPSMIVRACASDSCLSAPSSRACSAARMAIARRSVSAIAVSATSWLVAPKCTKSALFGSRDRTCVASAVTKPMDTVPVLRAERPISAASRLSMVELAIAAAASRGISPTAASACANAISKSSIAWSNERSENTSASSVVVARLSIRWDDIAAVVRDRRRRSRHRPEDECRTAMPQEWSRAPRACAAATPALGPELHRSR